MNNKPIKSIDDVVRHTSIPISATFELLTRCNVRCIHCYIHDYTQCGLPFDLLQKTLQSLRTIGTYRINLTGGEIFLYKDLLALIKEARMLGFSVNLLSNATLLDSAIIQELADLHISSFGTTVFSLSADIHDSITQQKGSLEKTLRSLKLLSSKQIPIEIKTPIMEHNKNSYAAVYQFSKDHGYVFMPTVSITPKVNGDRTPSALNISNNDLENAMNFLLKNGLLPSSTNMAGDDDYICHFVRNEIFINAHGDVFPCINFLYKLGTIYNENIAAICSSVKRETIINLRKKEFIQCQTCVLNKYCLPCPGLSLLEQKVMTACSLTAHRMAEIEYRLSKRRYTHEAV